MKVLMRLVGCFVWFDCVAYIFQVFSTVTFDAPSAAFQPDALSQLLGAQQKKMFMLHYQFPSFATTAISSSRRTTRRELGHGALAEKALKRLVPDNFPYCLRLACDVSPVLLQLPYSPFVCC